MLRAAQRAYPNFLWKTVLAMSLLHLFEIVWLGLFQPGIPSVTVWDADSTMRLFVLFSTRFLLFVPAGLLLPVLFQRWGTREAFYTASAVAIALAALRAGIPGEDFTFAASLGILGSGTGAWLYRKLARRFPEEGSFLMGVISSVSLLTGILIFLFLLLFLL